MTIRRVTAEERLTTSFTLGAYAFEASPAAPPGSRSSATTCRTRRATGRWWWRSAAPRSAAGSAIPMRQNLRGEVLPMAGVAGVASHPLARRQGTSVRCCTSSSTKCATRGTRSPRCYPFRAGFYGRFGYAGLPAATVTLLPGRPRARCSAGAARGGGLGADRAGYRDLSGVHRTVPERAARLLHLAGLPGRRAARPRRALAGHRQDRREVDRRGHVPDRRPRRHAGRRRPAGHRPARPGAAVAVLRPARRPGGAGHRPGRPPTSCPSCGRPTWPCTSRRGSPVRARPRRWPGCSSLDALTGLPAGPGRVRVELAGDRWLAGTPPDGRHHRLAGAGLRRRRRPGRPRRSPPPGSPPWRTGH